MIGALERYGLSLLFAYFAYQQGLVHNWLLVALNTFVIGLLLTNHAPAPGPTRASHVLVPLLGTFFFLAFNIAPGPYLWAPTAWGAWVVGAGYAVAIWGTIALGRSYGVFVSVRPLVRRGPYAYVNHPIYWGYVLIFAGILMQVPTARYIALTACYLALLAWRARLEDRALGRLPLKRSCANIRVAG